MRLRMVFHVSGHRTIEFYATGRPAGQGSKRHVGRGIMVESSKRVAPWRADVVNAALTAIADLDDPWEPLAQACHVGIYFYLARPRSHYRTGRHAAELRPDAPEWVTTSPDLDKMARATLDALTAAGLIADDRYVAVLNTEKCYVDEANPTQGAHIWVETIRSWDTP